MYDIRFRKQVLEIRAKEGLSIREVAKRFGISFRSVVSWLQRLEPKVKRNKPATKIDMVALAADVQLNPDSFLHERAARFGVTATGIRHALKRLKVTHKKKPRTPEGLSRGTWHLPKKAG